MQTQKSSVAVGAHTPGPWRHGIAGANHWIYGPGKENAALLAFAPALAAENARLRAALLAQGKRADEAISELIEALGRPYHDGEDSAVGIPFKATAERLLEEAQ